MPTDIAFVLGGGGMLGAAEVGMLRALAEADVRPDLVVGTSVGAINGAMVAADPLVAPGRLESLWRDLADGGPFDSSLVRRIRTFARSRTHLHDLGELRRMLTEALPVATFEELSIPFQCVAASIERAAPRWFTTGPLAEAVLASSAVPGLFPPVEIDGEHHYDGGLVHSIPLGRALAQGARTVYVLQVGRIEVPLEKPTSVLEVGLVTFEIARRNRFNEELARIPDDVDVHVLPTGDSEPVRYDDVRTQLDYRDATAVGPRITSAYEATADYLAERA
ncbi:MAG: patatin-like phospholipase family protein [Nitriliruptorales bacterium]|nr:patatin-like phospholipase family protein [Nitriliruptorales bacterium]